MGEAEEIIQGAGWPWTFSLAAESLVAVEEEPEYYSGCHWTFEQRRALGNFGQCMKYRMKDRLIWFGTDPRLDDVKLIHVWIGPDRTHKPIKDSGRDWVQVRIEDHPEDFRLGSEEESFPESEDEETEVECSEDEDGDMVMKETLDEDDNGVVEDSLDDPPLTSMRLRESSSSEGEDETQASESSEDLDEVT